MGSIFTFMIIVVIAIMTGSIVSEWLTASQLEACLKSHTPLECKVLIK